MGYDTPTEAGAKAENKDVGSTDHEYWYSWCDAYSYYGAKNVSAGSHPKSGGDLPERVDSTIKSEVFLWQRSRR